MISPQDPRYQEYVRLRAELFDAKRFDRSSGQRFSEEEIDHQVLTRLDRKRHNNGSSPPPTRKRNQHARTTNERHGDDDLATLTKEARKTLDRALASLVAAKSDPLRILKAVRTGAAALIEYDLEPGYDAALAHLQDVARDHYGLSPDDIQAQISGGTKDAIDQRWHSRPNGQAGGPEVDPAGSGFSGVKFDWRKTSIKMDKLAMKKFDPIKFLVPGLIPAEGITLICSKPKVGKSWLILDICLGSTCDIFVLGDRKPLQGDVLYLALEDSQRRLKTRAEKILSPLNRGFPTGLTVTTEWPRVDQGGVEAIREWIEATRKEGRSVAFVAIDVLAMVRPAQKKNQQNYDHDYATLAPLKQLSAETGVAIIIAHHIRKAHADDAQDRISGTLAIAGAVDASVVIDKSANGTTFSVIGRDVQMTDLAVEFNPSNCRWTILGAASEVHRTETRTKILNALRNAGKPMTPKAVTEVTALGPSNVKMTLARMLESGEVIREDEGKWTLPGLSGL